MMEISYSIFSFLSKVILVFFIFFYMLEFWNIGTELALCNNRANLPDIQKK